MYSTYDAKVNIVEKAAAPQALLTTSVLGTAKLGVMRLNEA